MGIQPKEKGNKKCKKNFLLKEDRKMRREGNSIE